MTHTRSAKSRIFAGVATLATVSAVSIPLMATAASAAVTAVTASPATYTQASPSTVTVTATVARSAGDATPIRFAIVSGPDADKLGNGTLVADGTCTGATTPVSCSYVNTTPGVDTVRIFADTNSNQVLDAGEPSSDATVTLFGAPAGVTITPTSDSAAAGTCNVFTVKVTDAGGRATPGTTVRLETTLTGTTTGRTLTYCQPVPDNNTPTTQAVGTPTTASGATPATGTVTTDANGQAAFGIRSDQPGTASVRAYVDTTGAGHTTGTFDAGEPSAVATKTFTSGGAGGNSAQDAVTGLTVSPTSQSAVVGDPVSYTVTAKNSAGDPTPNVVINYTITGANPSSGTLPTTNNNGVSTLTYTAAVAGTDTVTFFVNQTGGGTSGADATEPKATATTTTAAAPTGYTIDLTCKGTSANTTAEDCIEPLTNKSEVFTAFVSKGSTLSGPTPAAGILVRFQAVNTANPGLAAPVNFSAVTDAKGIATFTLTDSAAINNTKDTVTATIAGQTVPEAGGVSSDSGTVTFQTAKASILTLTPKLLTTQTGTASTFTATVTDQFKVPVSGVNVDFFIGSPAPNYQTGGRNSGVNGPSLLDKITNAAGQVSITYTDTGSVSSPGQDTVSAVADIVTEDDQFTAGEPFDTATNNFITEPATAATVDLDVTGTGTCGVTTTDPANDSKSYNPAVLTTTHSVCALAKTAGGAVLQGKSITFTLSGVGTFVKADGTALTSPQTVTTDANGVASILVASTTSGAQNITASLDGKSDAAVVTYNAAAPASARFIDLKPDTSNIAPGKDNELTARVTDVFGNPVAGITVDFTETGPGTFANGTSSQSGVTGATGTVTITLSSPAGTTGTETVTATISNVNGATQCNANANVPTTGDKAGNCSDTSTYTFKNAQAPTFILGTNVIAAGQFTKVVVSGAAGDSVQILVKGAASSSYTVIATQTLNSAGSTFLNVSPSTNSFYFVRNAAGSAAPKFLLVKAVQSVNVSKSGTTGIFAGLVKPSLQGRTVLVYGYLTGGHVATLCTTVVRAGGHFACNKAGLIKGKTYHVFAQTGADKYNAAGRSGLKDLTI